MKSRHDHYRASIENDTSFWSISYAIRHVNHQVCRPPFQSPGLGFRQSNFHHTHLALDPLGRDGSLILRAFPDMLWSPARFPGLQPLLAKVSRVSIRPLSQLT